jgi:hypothetical protein
MYYDNFFKDYLKIGSIVLGIIAAIALVGFLISKAVPDSPGNDIIVQQFKKCKDAGMDAWQGESMNVYCVPPGQKH